MALAAQIMALTGGWALIQSAIARATGLDANGAVRARNALQHLAESLVAAPDSDRE